MWQNLWFLVENNVCRIVTNVFLTEFQTWKSEYEGKNCVSYVMNCSAKKRANNTIKRYYYCHRSHTYKPTGQNKRSMKNIGSNKIGAGCPSSIELTVSPSGVHSVKIWPVHLGHTMEVNRCKLTKEERAAIASMSHPIIICMFLRYNV